ncbi:MAG: hypothetical protein ABJJ09_18000 [Ascidiaceihabitans sp.]|uniref:hypothetical protein n=1 Tax=Ascidiaceihabitans sp. TaxID=1872644 RepID=UPI0032988358
MPKSVADRAGEQAAEAVGFRGVLADVEVIELQRAFDVGELDFCCFGFGTSEAAHDAGGDEGCDHGDDGESDHDFEEGDARVFVAYVQML